MERGKRKHKSFLEKMMLQCDLWVSEEFNREKKLFWSNENKHNIKTHWLQKKIVLKVLLILWFAWSLPYIGENIWYLSLGDWLISLSRMGSRFCPQCHKCSHWEVLCSLHPHSWNGFMHWLTWVLFLFSLRVVVLTEDQINNSFQENRMSF